MDNNSIPKRSELRTEDTWALEDLYKDDAAWEQALNSCREEWQKIGDFQGKLKGSATELYNYISLLENVGVNVDMLAGYCHRKLDEDTANSVYQAMAGKFSAQMVNLRKLNSFAVPEIMTIPEADLENFYQQLPELERYRRYLTDMRRMIKHTLPAPEEKLMASIGEITQAPMHIYEMLTDADMTFADAVDSNGKTYPISQGTFVKTQESRDRVLRKSAFESLYGGFDGMKNTAAAILNAQNKSLKFSAEARSFDSALQASLYGNDVPVEVYTNLIDAVHENIDKMHRYVSVRKRLLGVDELHFYDVYAPLVEDAGKEYTFEEAKEIVFEALAPMGDAYRNVLKEGFDNRWIDVYQNIGKRSGAYSAGTPVHPYVLLNFNGTLDSVFTLAHEMGHALHSYYSAKCQNPVDSDYVIFVAEVASTCNEALLMEYLLKRTTDKKQRAYLINHFLEQFKGTLYRQTMFAEFELKIGQIVQKGETLTAELLCSEYTELNKAYFGSDMVIDKEIALEWARIPHFYYDYYVFQYATGYAAAIALSRRILRGDENAVSDYLQFLSGGCSRSPIDLLRGAGVDMSTSEPVKQALKLFDELLDEMEKLMES